MSLIKSLDIDTTLAGEEDRSGYQLFDSKVYDATIKMAYLRKAESGTTGLTLILDLEGKEFTKTIYITTKDGKTYTEKDGKKQNMMGFNLANSLAMVACGKPFAQLEDEERLQKVRNFAEKKDENVKVHVVVDLLDKEVKVGITRQKVNKQVKQNGTYVDTAEAVETNDIGKFFCAKKKFLNMTATEMLEAQSDDSKTAEFIEKWKEQNEGKVINRVKEVKGAAAAGAPKTGVSKPEAASDLFGDDD